MELKNISEGCSYALVIKGHNRAAQILVFLTALLNCFLSSLVELNYQSTSWVFKTGNDLPVFDMSESRGVAGFQNSPLPQTHMNWMVAITGCMMCWKNRQHYKNSIVLFLERFKYFFLKKKKFWSLRFQVCWAKHNFKWRAYYWNSCKILK